jgi:hypothetical protein
VTTIAAIADLLRSVPCVDAPLVTRAAWFDRKADLFDAIADAIADAAGPEAAEARRLALHARATASLIRRGRA